MIKKVTFLFLILTLSLSQTQAVEYGGGSADIFILDEDNDATGNITLQFGSALNKFFEWDVTNNRFNLNDTLRVFGNVEQDGNVLTLDADNGGEGANVDIVANQGSDNSGTIRYNATDNQWEISNDGGTFEAISSGGGGANISQQEATIASGAEQVFNHASDPNYERMVDIYYQDAEVVTDTSFWNVLTSEEGLYVQENSALTDFTGEAIGLQPSGSYTPGTTNLSLSATAIGSDATRAFSNGNDNSTGTFWYNQGGGPSAGHWWGVDLGTPTAVMRAQINWYSTTYHATSMRIEGSNDGTNWTTVSTVSPAGGNTTDETWDFSPATYRYWRFYCVTGANATYFVIREGRFFEAEGGGYQTTPAYVTTGASKSFNTINWSQINNIQLNNNEPAGTALRYLFSFDGRNTWYGFSGGTWNLEDLNSIETVGMTTAEVEALTATNWNEANGLNSGTNTLDYAVSLVTTDTNESPSHSGVELTYGTQTYWQKASESVARVRLVSGTAVSVLNLLGDSKLFKVNIILP